MTLVVALDKGYFGGEVREPGARFEVPDDLWKDEKRRPSWAEAVKLGGKGDHDGDGKDGGSKPASGDKPAKGKKAAAPEPEVFGDAPEPVVIAKSNGVKEALGAEPDWVAPKPID